jgi:hypothetical protein
MNIGLSGIVNETFQMIQKIICHASCTLQSRLSQGGRQWRRERLAVSCFFERTSDLTLDTLRQEFNLVMFVKMCVFLCDCRNENTKKSTKSSTYNVFPDFLFSIFFMVQ